MCSILFHIACCIIYIPHSILLGSAPLRSAPQHSTPFVSIPLRSVPFHSILPSHVPLQYCMITRGGDDIRPEGIICMCSMTRSFHSFPFHPLSFRSILFYSPVTCSFPTLHHPKRGHHMCSTTWSVELETITIELVRANTSLVPS